MVEFSTLAVTVTTFALEAREPGGPSGSAVVCPAARYASALWRGDDRPTRLHLPAGEWLALTSELELLEAGSIADRQSPLAIIVTDGRDAILRCVGARELRAHPFALPTDLDALLVAGPGRVSGSEVAP